MNFAKVILVLGAATALTYLSNQAVFRDWVFFPDEGTSALSPKGNNQENKILGIEDLKDGLAFSWREVNGEEVSLLPNFEEKSTSNKLIEENNCKALINGGFYTPQNRPIGLFVSNGEKIGQAATNNTFNGFVSSNGLQLVISDSIPTQNFPFQLQTGPLLKINGQTRNLSLKNDETARRSVVATTREGSAVFLIIFSKDLNFSGPLLEDLPEVLVEIETILDLSFVDAINLDGGAASAFYNQDISFSEASPIGSYFCVK